MDWRKPLGKRAELLPLEMAVALVDAKVDGLILISIHRSVQEISTCKIIGRLPIQVWSFAGENMFHPICRQIFLFSLCMFLFVAVQSVAAQEDRAAEGKNLYELRCVTCHGIKAEKLAGKPTDYLEDRMQSFKEMDDPLFEKVRRMQAALAPLSDEQLKHIAIYLNGLK